MVSQRAVDALKQELREAKSSDKLKSQLNYRRGCRSKLSHLLKPSKLTETRNGTKLAGLREMLANAGGPSDSSRFIKLVDVSSARNVQKVKIWCKQLLNTRAEFAERLAVTQDSRRIPHLGRNTFSILLHHKEPSKFGYLNQPVEESLRKLGEWPRRFSPGFGQGDKYLHINAILNELADRAGLNSYKDDRLAVLDLLLWYYRESNKKAIRPTMMGILQPGDPDKDAENFALEGGKKWVGPHLKSERNSLAATAFKKQRADKFPNLECEICSFSFLTVYGEELGKGFIEAHHRKPVSGLLGAQRPEAKHFDFVCSNCHRMLHRMDLSKMDKFRLRRIVKTRRLAARSAVERHRQKTASAHR